MKTSKLIAVGGAMLASLFFGTTGANGQISTPTYDYAVVVKIAGEVCLGQPGFNNEVPANGSVGNSGTLGERRGLSSDDFIKDCAEETGRKPETLALVLIKENSQPMRFAVVDNDDLKNNGQITPICILFEVTENICSFVGLDGGAVVPRKVTKKEKNKKGKTEKARVTYCQTWKIACGDSGMEPGGEQLIQLELPDEGQMFITQVETLSVPVEQVSLVANSEISLIAAEVSGKIVLCCHAGSNWNQDLNALNGDEGRIYSLDFDSKGNNPLAIDGVNMTLINAARN